MPREEAIAPLPGIDWGGVTMRMPRERSKFNVSLSSIPPELQDQEELRLRKRLECLASWMKLGRLLDRRLRLFQHLRRTASSEAGSAGCWPEVDRADYPPGSSA